VYEKFRRAITEVGKRTAKYGFARYPVIGFMAGETILAIPLNPAYLEAYGYPFHLAAAVEILATTTAAGAITGVITSALKRRRTKAQDLTS
jgi:hypothetical protein